MAAGGGWTAIAIGMAGWVPYALWLAVLIGVYASAEKNGEKWINLYTKDVYFLLLVQGLAMLFLPGDCGDAPGGGAWIERIVSMGGDVCRSSLIPLDILFVIFFVFFWAYVTTLIVVTCRSLMGATVVPAQAQPFRYIRRTVIVSASLLVLFLLMSGYQQYRRRQNAQQAKEDAVLFLTLVEQDKCEDLKKYLKKVPGNSTYFINAASIRFSDCIQNRAVRTKDAVHCDEMVLHGSKEECVSAVKEAMGK